MTYDKTLCTNEACPIRHNCLRGAVVDIGGYEIAHVHPFVYDASKGGCDDWLQWPEEPVSHSFPQVVYVDPARMVR